MAAVLAAGLVPDGSVRATPAPPPLSSQAACPARAPRGHVTCFARVLTRNSVRVEPRFAAASQPPPPADPPGYTPSDIAAAYNLPPGGGGGTIGIVDVHDDPSAESDLAAYRARFGLPPCTTLNGCFRKRNQDGGFTYPVPDPAWAAEVSLDLDAASAACPACHLVLIETDSDLRSSVAVGVDQAVRQGAAVVSLSLGGAEEAAQLQDDPSFNHPGVAIFASSGDSGYDSGPEYPATSPTVIAVGGTTLRRDSAGPRGWTETVWGPGTSTAPDGPGSGCSRYEPKPDWQTDPGCSSRTTADVAADADPATGLAVYDTYGAYAGWAVFGGTSLAAPLVAGITARGGGTGASSGAELFYRPTASLNDVVTGTNSLLGCPSVPYLCTAGPGYDGPTGNGTPNGIPVVPPPIVDRSLVAVRGTDGAMWVQRSGAGYAPYGGRLLAAPAVSARSNGDHLYVVLGTDHRLYQRTDAIDFQLAAPDGYCLDSPGVYRSRGSATVACEGGDHQLWVNDGSVDANGIFHATAWRSLGGILASGPSIALVQGQPHYFVEGSDHLVYDRTADTGFVTTGWACLGHQAVVGYVGRAYFACHGTDGQAWSAVNNGARWSPTLPLGGALVDGTGLAPYAGGATLYVEGTDQQIYSMLLDAWGVPRGGFAGRGGQCTGGAGAATS
ncbi:MAG: hypothetical protein NVSMB29_08540 [Candidatus Dormibacteria bacterium]